MASSNSMPRLPAGFRFHPTDEELIVHYLMNQAASIPCPVPIIAEVNIYQCNPWDLPRKALFGEKEWYFFSPRERKYPNGARPNRAAGSGYWKATGTDKAILSTPPTSDNVGVKKALVFYRGKPPRGVKTGWIMHEYRLTNTTATKRSRGGSSSMMLDDWVLCRIHKKSNDFQFSEQEGSSTVDEEADSSFLNNDGMNGGEAETSPRYEKASNDDDHPHRPSMMIESCSLTDLLSSIDYSALSQLLLDAPPAEEPEPQQQQRPLIYPTPPCQHPLINYYMVNEQPQVDDLCPDYGASYNNNGLKRKRIMTVLDDGASSFFDDGSRVKEKLQLPSSDSRSAGGTFFGSTSGYCNQQLMQ